MEESIFLGDQGTRFLNWSVSQLFTTSNEHRPSRFDVYRKWEADSFKTSLTLLRFYCKVSWLLEDQFSWKWKKKTILTVKWKVRSGRHPLLINVSPSCLFRDCCFQNTNKERGTPYPRDVYFLKEMNSAVHLSIKEQRKKRTYPKAFVRVPLPFKLSSLSCFVLNVSWREDNNTKQTQINGII